MSGEIDMSEVGKVMGIQEYLRKLDCNSPV